MGIRFDNKVAIITGAGNGLGRSYALFLASRGAKVLVNDLGTTKMEAAAPNDSAQLVAEEIKSKGGVAVANIDSVADLEGAQRIVDDALRHFGTIDILIK